MKHQLFAGIATGITCLALTLAPIGAAQAQQEAQEEAQATNSAQQSRTYDLGAGDLGTSLDRFAEQNGFQIGYPPALVSGKTAPALRGEYSATQALDRLLAGSGLEAEFVNDRAIVLRQTPAATGETIGQRRPGIEEIIVTGQKREERIQDVPIAISAFSMEDLEAQKIEGGFDLLKAIPNVTFSKTNFTSYNFQIRGVGTQAVSATTDAGVAVAFNSSGLLQNRLFEQEYLDVERVEVLRGPQGTLYGRNATAGVINVISNKAELGVWGGMLDVEVGNFNTRRLRGHFNMPIGDTWAVRGAYASTDREGYDYNSITENRVNGRDLWTGRLSIAWQPNDRLRADLIYERFEEDDNRSRTGKQLCHRDPGPEVVGDTQTVRTPVDDPSFVFDSVMTPALFSTGCQPGSLYDDEAFGTPNGLALPPVFAILAVTADCANGANMLFCQPDVKLGFVEENGTKSPRTILDIVDPFASQRQSRDLREIASIRDPRYRAEADIYQLNVDFDLTDTLTLTSQTVYNEDSTYSFQDFNRFNTRPIINDSSSWVKLPMGDPPSPYRDFTPGGVFCDPQIGCTNRLAAFDIAQASSEQFSQEIRVQSAFAGPINFSLGANYTEFETEIDYYVMYNLLTALSLMPPLNSGTDVTGQDVGIDIAQCNFGASWLPNPSSPSTPSDNPLSNCPFIDPNPVDTSRNFGTGGNNEGEGHNYFRSKNPYELESWAAFGELYWNIQQDLKLTLGLRYTDDRKIFDEHPSQALLAPSVLAGGYTSIGYPKTGTIDQQWGEWTGRLVLDWQPVLNFTDETLLYASFSRGYKGGGANPPTPGFATKQDLIDFGSLTEGEADLFDLFGFLPALELTAVDYGPTFEPEFVNAYEVGTKNTLFGGAVMLNMTAFYYDYTDYQVSQIKDRTAVNENFDAEMWGLELESIFSPTPNWQFLANIGYLKTKIAEGETSIDIMNRTQDNPDYTVLKPWVQLPSNCVVPTPVAESFLLDYDAEQSNDPGILGWWSICGGYAGLALTPATVIDPNPEFGNGNQPYDHTNYPELNGGAGLRADLGGNELPQAPRFTVTLGSQYSFDLTPEWRATARLDYYWQDESYHRVYNLEPYDRLKSWSNTNLSFWVKNANSGITVEAYVKNLFDEYPITGAFLNSDDTGLTTNVFTLDPRLIGVSVRKEW